MKTIEEKAEAYDEAIERAKKELGACGSQDCEVARLIFRLFPGLRESESERIRQLLIRFVKYEMPNNYSDDFSKEDCLARFEKQGEQKPNTDSLLTWSEDDEYYRNIILYILNNECVGATDKENAINWFKSLRPQNRWKPSDEQIKALKEVCDEHWEPDGLDPLYMLLEQLKKLREE